MSSSKSKSKKSGAKKKAQRATSNVFAMFDQTQIHEFKEAFNVIDQDRDGIITAKDLTEMIKLRPWKEMIFFHKPPTVSRWFYFSGLPFSLGHSLVLQFS